MKRGRVDRVVFPPEEVAQVKAIACELPKDQGVPLSRFSRSELHRFVVERGVCDASASTIGRWLAEDAIRPWQHRSWIFRRDPDFLEKAGRVLDLYAGRWEGKLLEPGDMVISADAKPSIQARRRVHATGPPRAGHGQLVEHEYERLGAICSRASHQPCSASATSLHNGTSRANHKSPSIDRSPGPTAAIKPPIKPLPHTNHPSPPDRRTSRPPLSARPTCSSDFLFSPISL